MRIGSTGATMLAVMSLSGCHRPAQAPEAGPGAHSRYLGVGVYAAGELWSRMKVAVPTDAAAATVADDEHVIVVVDSRTGEVRQCGDYSAVCIGMNPWRAPPAMPAGMPVSLTKHAGEVAAEERKAEEAKSNGH